MKSKNEILENKLRSIIRRIIKEELTIDDKKILKTKYSIPLQIINSRGFSWNKRGGHAGSKLISKMRSDLKSAGWKKLDSKSTTSQNDNVSNIDAVISPDEKYIIEFYERYGSLVSENYFAAILKLNAKKNNGKILYVNANGVRTTLVDDIKDASMHWQKDAEYLAKSFGDNVEVVKNSDEYPDGVGRVYVVKVLKK